MKINPSILAYINNDPAANEGADPLQAKALADSRSFCERTIIEDFLRLCDIPGISPQWCIDEIQRNLQAECGNQYSCLITENDPSTVASLHDYRGRSEKYYAICGDVTNREINTSKLQSACFGAFGNCWDSEQTADCMKNFLYGREDDEIYQYCPEGENNVLVALQEKEIKIASQNPDGNTGRNNQMPYQCVAYCTGGSEFIHPIIETCNDEGIRPPAYECALENSCGEHAECVLDDDFNESCICTLGFEYVENDCRDINECEAGTHECGSGQCFNLKGTYRCNSAVDVVWAVDGTGSYKRNVERAEANFREQIEYFKLKKKEGMDFC